MKVTNRNIAIQYNDCNGNEGTCGLVALDFMNNISKDTWQIESSDHEKKGNFDFVLSNKKGNFECFEFKSCQYLKNGDFTFNLNQIENSNKVYGFVLKGNNRIEHIIFCQFDIEDCINKGIFYYNGTNKQPFYRFKFDKTNKDTFVEDGIMLKNGISYQLKILAKYNRNQVEEIVRVENQKRSKMKKYFQ